MGNSYNIKWKEKKISANRMHHINTKVKAKLTELNETMSSWDNNSELSLLNNSKEKQFNISPDLEYVISEAIRIHHVTHGALDITVDPLISLWGFGATDREYNVPSHTDISKTLKFVGMDKINVADGALTRTSTKVTLNLSSIAKGFAVDAVTIILEKNHIKDYLVDIGGEIRLNGTNLNNKSWNVGIDKPFAYSTGQIEIVKLKNRAIATSGNYRKYFESNGKHYSHIINPKNGQPVEYKIVSATVIAERCMTADGFATAFMVLPVKQSLDIANKHNIPVMLIEDKFGKLITHYSVPFNRIQEKQLKM
ncbi:ApbE family lipoprotein [Shewanella halifaxensis HAW-EB4]|uniref:FAD:protein FMN transferase n=2 Tax=Shewanella halifaxensis TaxID=271098 RepID=B0TIQ2_SHEHH|nr:ApbE family lipoprotein [Shewanella halifaxensis HAW-EB4]